MPFLPSGRAVARRRIVWFSALLLMPISASLAQNSIKIGLSYPNTGRYQELGIEQANGALLAIEEINRQGGLNGNPLEMITAKGRSRASKVAENIRSLANQGAVMVFGGSPDPATAIAEASQHALVYFDTLTYSSTLDSRQIAKRRSGQNRRSGRNVFQASYDSWMAAKALGFYLKQSISGQRVFYVTADADWGRQAEDNLRRFTGTEDRSHHPATSVAFPRPRPHDLDRAIQQAADSKADVLVLIQYSDDLASALRAAHNAGIKKRMTIVVPNLSLSIARGAGADAMEGVYGTTPWCWQVPSVYRFQKGQDFISRYVEAHKEYPSYAAATAYSVVHEFYNAAQRAGSTHTNALIQALEGHTYIGVKDPQTWRSFDHQSVQSVYIVKGKKRETVIASQYRQDYFDVLFDVSGLVVARTPNE